MLTCSSSPSGPQVSPRSEAAYDALTAELDALQQARSRGGPQGAGPSGQVRRGCSTWHIAPLAYACRLVLWVHGSRVQREDAWHIAGVGLVVS